MNSIKKDLIFALEDAENEGKEICVNYVNDSGFVLSSYLIPDIMIFDDQIDIWGDVKNHIVIPLRDIIEYETDENGEWYIIRTEDGKCSINIINK